MPLTERGWGAQDCGASDRKGVGGGGNTTYNNKNKHFLVGHRSFTQSK